MDARGSGPAGPGASGPRLSEATVQRELALAFAPVHKAALGVAVGVASGLVLFALTGARLLLDDEGRTSLALLAQYLWGYQETWAGAFVGLAWGFFVGFVAGWFVAFVRNLALATWAFAVQARADFAGTSDFLDHI